MATTCPGLCTDCCPAWEEPPSTRPTTGCTEATTPPTSPTGTKSLEHTIEMQRDDTDTDTTAAVVAHVAIGN